MTYGRLLIKEQEISMEHEDTMEKLKNFLEEDELGPTFKLFCLKNEFPTRNRNILLLMDFL